MSNFKQYKFKSTDEHEILQAVEIFNELGYSQYSDVFNIALAVKFNGVCTWGDGKITEGYLVSNTHEDITLEELNSMGREVSSHNSEANENKVCERRLTWDDVFGKSADRWNKKLKNRIEDIKKYRMLFGVQFNKNIYSFRECSPRYVHDIVRDKDGDVCVVDQYGVDCKLRDVEFYVSDEHDGTATYNDYVLLVNT